MQTILQMALKQIHKVNAAAHWAIPAEAFAQSAVQPAVTIMNCFIRHERIERSLLSYIIKIYMNRVHQSMMPRRYDLVI
jgi:hypothetical protein